MVLKCKNVRTSDLRNPRMLYFFKGESFNGRMIKLMERRVFPPAAGNLILPLIARSDSLWELVLNTIRNIRPYELSPAHMAAAPRKSVNAQR
jgi:hypothetical protein